MGAPVKESVGGGVPLPQLRQFWKISSEKNILVIPGAWISNYYEGEEECKYNQWQTQKIEEGEGQLKIYDSVM